MKDALIIYFNRRAPPKHNVVAAKITQGIAQAERLIFLTYSIRSEDGMWIMPKKFRMLESLFSSSKNVMRLGVHGCRHELAKTGRVEIAEARGDMRRSDVNFAALMQCHQLINEMLTVEY